MTQLRWGWYFSRMASKNYQPVERYGHSTVKVGDYLYMWGGDQPDLPETHDSEMKKEMTSLMDMCHLPTGKWEQRPTNGNPPLGVWGYSSVAIGKEIYYFGGYCGHSGCYHNSLHSFNVDTFTWRELSPSTSDHGPMMKANCGMVALHSDGEDYLVVIAGKGSSSNDALKNQPSAKYARSRCNEIHYYKISADQWISPVVTGDRPPPISSFTLTPVTNNTAVMFGGYTPNGASNKLYMLSFTKTSVGISEVPNPEGSVEWPEERWAHSSVLIDTSSGPHLLVVGGWGTKNSWLLDINKKIWQEQINLPVNVTWRYDHSLLVWSVTPATNWIIEFGGETSYKDTTVIELRYTSDNDWSTSVIPLDQYQDQLRRRILSDWENLGMEKQLQIVQDHLQQREREFYQEQLQREIKEKEQIQQDQNKKQLQLLQEKATLSQQLDDATTLLEQTEKDKSTLELEGYEEFKAKFAKNEVYITRLLEEKTQVEEEKRIISENYEILKIKFAELLKGKEPFKEEQIIFDDNQNLETETKKDKVVTAKLTSQVEEQSQNEKLINIDLKNKVSDNELYATKLLKEKTQLLEKVAFLEEQSIKETSSIGLQFNYLVPSMDKLDCLSDVQVAEKKLFLIQGDKPQLMNWEKYGLRIGVQEASLSSTDTVEAAVVALVGGQFQFPPNAVLVSAVYAVSLSKPLLKRLILEIQHCIDLTGRPALSCHLKFAIAPVSTPSLPYHFSIVEGGDFKPDSWYGSIERKEFCLVAIVGEKRLPKSLTNEDESEEEEEEEEQEEQAEEETEEEVEDGDSDSSSDSDKTKDPPGGSSGGQRESTSNEAVEEEGETGGQPLHEEGNEEQDNERVEESKDHEEPQHEEATAPKPCTEISSDFNIESNTGEQVNATEKEGLEGDTSIDPVEDGEDLREDEETEPQPQEQTAVGTHSTGVEEAATYAGLVYYEKKEAEDLVTFTAAKKLNALLEFIKNENSSVERGQNVYFSYDPSCSYIELKFDAPQDEPFTGWSIKPHLKPCRLRRCDIDNFGDANYPLPPCCLVSVYGSPGAVPSLHYSVPLDGVADPVTLFIHRSLRTAPPLPPPANLTTSFSNESTSVSSTGGVTTVGNKVKKVINDVLVSHYADLNSLPKKSFTGLVNQLYTAKLISNEVREAPSMEECIDEFKASLSFKRKLPQVQDHCQKFLSSFIAVRGSYADAAIALGEDWIEAIRNELGLDFNININT